MIPDSIVEEVSTAGDNIAKECDEDVDRIFEDFGRREASGNTPHVSLSPRRIGESDAEEEATLRGCA